MQCVVPEIKTFYCIPYLEFHPLEEDNVAKYVVLAVGDNLMVWGIALGALGLIAGLFATMIFGALPAVVVLGFAIFSIATGGLTLAGGFTNLGWMLYDISANHLLCD